MKRAAAGLLFFLISVPLNAQQEAATKPQDKCLIEGVVLSSTDAQPLKRAVVMAQRIAPNETQHYARTDATGHFSFADLTPGEYNLWVNRNGYLAMAYGQATPNAPGKSLTLRPDEQKRDVVFHLTPMGSITGHVYDEDQDPIVGAGVQVVQTMYVNGHRRMNQTMGASTDDAGQYRISQLPPGKYYLSATYTESFPIDGERQGYIPVYYPNSDDLSNAVPIEIHAGDQVTDIDFRIIPVPAVTIRGQVVNVTGRDFRQGINVALMRQGAGGTYFQGNTFVNQQQGTFELRDVPPGSYVLTSGQWDHGRQYSGRQMLIVGNGDINGVTLTLGPGSELTGRIHVESDPPSDKLIFGNMQVYLEPREEMQNGAPPGQVDKAGSFSLKNIPDGPYNVKVTPLPPDFYLKAARLGTNDVLEGGLICDQANSPGTLDLLISGDGGRIEGVVTHYDKAFPGATVTLVPDVNHRNQERLYSTTMSDSNGHFVLQGIPPGNYSMFAWEQIDNGAYMDPEFLRSYEDRGRTAQVDPQGRMNVDLDLIPTKHESPPEN
jgi:Carboxypeptidase regulatory-like domain